MATIKQTQMIAGRMVEFQDRFSALSNDDAQYVIQNAGDAIELFIKAIAERAKSVVQKIENVIGNIISTTTIPATTEKFIAKNNFIVDTSENANVKISWLSGDFKDWFLLKVENPFPGSEIVARQLIKRSVDAPILKELGGNEKAETTLAEVYAMMQKQANGKSGALLINGWANIFYVKDISGTLRAVRVYWFDDGWFVHAYSIELPHEWDAGHRVFSRNPLAA